MAPHQTPIYRRGHEIRDCGRTSSKRRVGALATSILGAHDSRRRRFRAARGLRSLQSSEARPRRPRVRLAAFLVPPLCAPWAVATGLGRRFHPGSGELWREALIIPDFATLNPGLLATNRRRVAT